METPDYARVITQPLNLPETDSRGVALDILRLDLLHPEISGNKWFKLKHNLEEAASGGFHTVLTFGGAWSNHIAATAAACRLEGLKSVGIIRGGEPARLSPTLLRARENGMQLDFISREQYREKEDPGFLKRLTGRYPDAYMIPEGGNNAAGLKGCLEIPAFYRDGDYTDICCSVGTGTTLCALITAAGKETVTGFAALKNAAYLEQTIRRRIPAGESKAWQLVTEYHFGGFGKKTEVLLSFMREFYARYAVPLDVVYTAKMMFGVLDLVKKGYFRARSRILAIHTGGLQGNQSLPTFTPQQTLP